MGETLDTRTALTVEPNTTDLFLVHRPSGLSYKMDWTTLKGLIESISNTSDKLDEGGADEVSAADLATIVSGSVDFTEPSTSFVISNEDLDFGGNAVPNSRLQAYDSVSGYTFTNAVQDLSNLGGDYQAVLSAFDLVANTGFIVQANSSGLEVKHTSSGTTTAALVIEDAKVKIKTPLQISTSITNGAILRVINASTGECEFIETQWTTATRPSSPTTEHDGFNSTLSQREYWNGSAWVQY